MESLRRMVEDNQSKNGRIFEWVIQFLIVLSLVTFSIETLPDLSERSRYWLNVTEIVIVLLFTAEYLLRILVADQKLKFIFSFYGLIDLISILPFYLATHVDLRSMRTVRLLRLFRVLKLARYNKAMARYRKAILLAKEEIILYVIVTLLVLYFAAVGIYYFEHKAQPETFSSVFHSLWWALATITTVGYGDIYPVTAGGRFFTFIVLLLGLLVVSVPAGLVAAALSETRVLDEERDTNENAQQD